MFCLLFLGRIGFVCESGELALALRFTVWRRLGSGCELEGSSRCGR